MTSRREKIPVPVILGPTAAGKTAVALQIAGARGIPVISCDSRQVYRSMDIGTAKPSRADLERVPHRLIDILDPTERYSAFDFAHDAGAIIRDLAGSGRQALVCGGTGLYFDCLRSGIGPQVASDPALRERYLQRAAHEGVGPLYCELRRKDPESAARIHEHDLQRIVRALVVVDVTGQSFAALKRKTRPPDDLEFRVAVLMPERAALYEAINRRVDGMVRAGLWEEFISLRSRGYDAGTPGLQCVGYRELFAVEKGTRSFADAVEEIKRNTRRYAKRQITWFTSRHGSEVAAWPGSGRGSWTDIMALVMEKP